MQTYVTYEHRGTHRMIVTTLDKACRIAEAYGKAAPGKCRGLTIQGVTKKQAAVLALQISLYELAA